MKKKWLAILVVCLLVVGTTIGVVSITKGSNEVATTKSGTDTKSKKSSNDKKVIKDGNASENKDAKTDTKKDDVKKAEKKSSEDSSKTDKSEKDKADAKEDTADNAKNSESSTDSVSADTNKTAVKNDTEETAKPEASGANADKTWVPPVYKEVSHPEQGHYENQQTGTKSEKTGEQWLCACGQTFPSYDAWLAQKNENGG